MQLIVRGRAGGKTTLMVEWAIPDVDRVILAPNDMHAQHTREMLVSRLVDDGCSPNVARRRAEAQVVTPRQLERLRDRKIRLGIDELEALLYQLVRSNAPIELVTFTGEVDSGPPPMDPEVLREQVAEGLIGLLRSTSEPFTEDQTN